jgi:hypothetical protein
MYSVCQQYSQGQRRIEGSSIPTKAHLSPKMAKHVEDAHVPGLGTFGDLTTFGA